MTLILSVFLGALLAAAFCVYTVRTAGMRRALTVIPAVGVTAAVAAAEGALQYLSVPAHGLLQPVLLLQGLLCPAWLLFGLAYARGFSWQGLSLLNRLLLFASFIPALLVVLFPVSRFLFLPDFTLEQVIYLEPLAFSLYLLIILFLLVALGNLEATLRNARHSDRWRVKLALVGGGTVLMAHVLFYSQGLLHRSIDMNYGGLRTAGSMLGIAMLFFAELRRESGRVTVTGRFALRSTVVLLAGVYLIGLGIAREGVRHFGSEFERHAAIGLLFLLGLAVVLVLLSERVRRRLRIWLQRNFYQDKYDYRSQWMEFTRRLAGVRGMDELTRTVLLHYCEAFGFVGGAWFAADHETQGRVTAGEYYEMDEPQVMPESIDFSLIMELQAPVAIPVLKDRLAAAGRMEEAGCLDFVRATRAEVVVPVAAGDSFEGLLLLGPAIDRSEAYDTEDFELMDAMAHEVGLTVKSFRLGNELAAAREMEAMGKVAAFVLHDLKNQVYTLSLVTENARDFIGEPDFQADMLESLENTVTKMKVLITQLKHLPDAGSLRLAPVDMHELVRKAALQVPGVRLVVQGPQLVAAVDEEQIEKVFVNLFLNAVEAGGDRPVTVTTVQQPVFSVSVRDSAGGIDRDILRRGLFKPFRSTKRRGMGIGLYHCKKIVEAHGAALHVRNRPGEGAEFVIEFAPQQEKPQSAGNGGAKGASV
ncbi:multi-sensor signal transduction histidine kinase [Oleidesulfovibrio alaskensis G20]|jgi:putative PEP-CTERM system histidine kinase|uniref:histidine kinase n=1 Tax=Oleidesulfovibrio alaskensis (strain ATCC BAA-1058 / DSM 17464 / G20) TaxID=207559 RepID=Q314J6_OLEA2|nr:XrtA/PEP-CTERM system histidine kinase PrsK [Oleidesulfovibrio alaskensis]ABB37650.1 multi-sensor signal transduction histidine kinase [Oleidesulfovibrio alaskensis G20]MBG0773571.1 PEP-CTERM system histidine kinase PrsK [Oleidesulfovibrio alaskensis]